MNSTAYTGEHELEALALELCPGGHCHDSLQCFVGRGCHYLEGDLIPPLSALQHRWGQRGNPRPPCLTIRPSAWRSQCQYAPSATVSKDWQHVLSTGRVEQWLCGLTLASHGGPSLHSACRWPPPGRCAPLCRPPLGRLRPALAALCVRCMLSPAVSVPQC